MAAGIMKHLLAKNGIDAVVESAGTVDWNVGSPADHRAIRTAKQNGIDISSHRARQIHKSDFDRFDLIYVMDRSNQTAVHRIAPPAVRQKVQHILDIGNSEHDDVGDPYHSDDRAFIEVFNVLKERCEELIESGMFGDKRKR